MLFVKWLVENPERRKQFQSALLEMKQRSSTELEPLVEKHFNLKLDDMETAWLKWAKAKLKKE